MTPRTPHPAAIARAARPEDASQNAQRVVISLPLPDAILHPNKIGSANGFAVSRARARARKEAALVASSEAVRVMPVGLPWANVRAVATFSGISPLTDSDNAYGWLKNVRDGIADALCGGSDHGWTWEEPRYERGAKGVTIEVWPICIQEDEDAVSR